MNQTPDSSVQTQPAKHQKSHADDYASYPELDRDDAAPPPPPSPTVASSENWTSVPVGGEPTAPSPSGEPSSVSTQSACSEGPAPISSSSATAMPTETNPYVSSTPVATSSSKNKIDSVRDLLEKWGKRAVEATKKGQDLAGNMWQHLKTGPSMADAALGRIAQGTKVIAEGGYDKIFRHTFETVPEEQLQKAYACYLSTSGGPVMGVLYLSTAKLAFSSDNPLSYEVGGGQTQWSYYKVVIPLHQLKAVNPSTSQVNQAEKYIQVISVDNHEFWFMGFVNYDSAVKILQDTLKTRDS